MRLVRRFCTPRRRRDVDEHAPALDLDRERWHAILFESIAHAGEAMELPTVPRTSDVIAVETAFAERPTDVVADIRHRAELSILNEIAMEIARALQLFSGVLASSSVLPTSTQSSPLTMAFPQCLVFVLKCGAKLLVFARKRRSRPRRRTIFLMLAISSRPSTR